MVRTRFAPSPTGFLHVGGVRTALFAWLVAKQSGGQFILRIEDTDRSRHVEESEQHIMESLQWLGLKWDEGPIRQSQRLDIYKQWAQRLIDSDRAYADTRTPQELEKIRQEFAKAKKPVLFRQRRPDNPTKWQPGMPLRFKSEPKSYKWHDEIMGELSAGPEAIDDFISLKSDGFPTYNFAHIIDDAENKISHVIRSQEFLPSVPKFLNLYEALQIERPKLATLPFVLGPDGNKKLSKRDGAKDVLDYRHLGYLPEALTNFLATLGWNDGSDQEIFSVEELIKKFSLSRVHHGGARFDEKRLEWMNGHYIRALSVDELYERIQKADEGYWGKGSEASAQEKKAILVIVQDRLKYFAELGQLTWFFFEEPTIDLKLVDDNKQLKKLSREEQVNLLKKSREGLAKSDFSLDDLAKRLNGLLAEMDQKPAVLFSLIRLATTWAPASPGLAETLEILGRQKSLGRLDKAIAALEK